MKKKIEEKAKEYSREIYPYPTIEMPDSDLQTALIIGYKKALQQTPSSLPTDEEIRKFIQDEHRISSVTESWIEFNVRVYKKLLRTKFSSEKCEGEKWISVEKYTPELYKDVLVISGHGNLLIAQIGGDREMFFNSRSPEQPYIEKVTHWMPLPTPPKQEQQTTK